MPILISSSWKKIWAGGKRPQAAKSWSQLAQTQNPSLITRSKKEEISMYETSKNGFTLSRIRIGLVQFLTQTTDTRLSLIFQWCPKLLGLGRQIELINFGIFSAEFLALFVGIRVPCSLEYVLYARHHNPLLIRNEILFVYINHLIKAKSSLDFNMRTIQKLVSVG